MILGGRLRTIREQRKLSHGDIEKRTGLRRCYVSRVENGRTIPSVETLEKMTRALEVPLYQFFYEGEEPPKWPNLPKRGAGDKIAWGRSRKQARFLRRLLLFLGRMSEPNRRLVFAMAKMMARR